MLFFHIVVLQWFWSEEVHPEQPYPADPGPVVRESYWVTESSSKWELLSPRYWLWLLFEWKLHHRAGTLLGRLRCFSLHAERRQRGTCPLNCCPFVERCLWWHHASWYGPGHALPTGHLRWRDQHFRRPVALLFQQEEWGSHVWCRSFLRYLVSVSHASSRRCIPCWSVEPGMRSSPSAMF